jgi:hypothetical protein
LVSTYNLCLIEDGFFTIQNIKLLLEKGREKT